MAFGLLPFTAVDVLPGTSTVVNVYWALAELAAANSSAARAASEVKRDIKDMAISFCLRQRNVRPTVAQSERQVGSGLMTTPRLRGQVPMRATLNAGRLARRPRR